jgi:hypothetical protein
MVVSLNSRLEIDKDEEEALWSFRVHGVGLRV